MGRYWSLRKVSPHIEVKIGRGTLIPGFENGIIGMKIGETKTIILPPEEAYGPRRKELMVDVKKSNFSDNIMPSVGKRLQIQQPYGNVIDVTVTDIDESTITLDANHPQAGEILIIDVQLVEIT